jgi:hypothetical protein
MLFCKLMMTSPRRNKNATVNEKYIGCLSP